MNPLSRSNLNRKRIVLLGLGREGTSSYDFLRKLAPDATFILADRNEDARLGGDTHDRASADGQVTWMLGEGYLDALESADLIVKTAGIPHDLEAIEAARTRGVPVISNTALFFEYVPGLTIGVTGTKGKSTTTTCIHHVLSAAGLPSRLTGNIGIPPLDTLDHDSIIVPDANAPESSAPSPIYAIELSSFQLNDIARSPDIAVVQHIAPEHLDFHRTFERYLDAKARITEFQSERDLLIYNHDSPTASAVAARTKARKISFGLGPPPGTGCSVKVCSMNGVSGETIVWREGDDDIPLVFVEDVPLKGRFNLLNVMPALIVARTLGVGEVELPDALRSFRALEHRLEPCGEREGIRFFNDSLATVPEATIAALGALEGASVVLIAGGYDRGLDYRRLGTALASAPLRALVLFPPTGDRIAAAYLEARSHEARAGQYGTTPRIISVETMDQAVDRAAAEAVPGDVVLLSPASASFGRFVDYRDRGEQFKRAVHRAQINSCRTKS